MVLIGGCKSKENETIPTIDNKIENSVKISSQNNEYECKVFHTPEGTTTVKFISPANLRGFIISRSGGKYEVSQDDLEGGYLRDPIQNNCAVKYMIDVLEELNKDERTFKFKSEEEGEKTYSGLIDGKGCDVILNSKGELIRISLEDLGINIEFRPEIN